MPQTKTTPAKTTPGKTASKAIAAKSRTNEAAPAKKPAAAAKADAAKGPAKSLRLGATTASTSTAPDGTLSLRLQRTIKAPPERIYQCFIDPDAMAKWLPPHGFTGKVHSIEPRVGGRYRMSFSTIDRKWTSFFGGTYKQLVPGKRIVHTDRFEDESMGKGEMTVTIDLTPVAGGTRVDILQSGIPQGPAADGAPYGWSQSLDNLANLCEQEIPF